MAMARSVNLGSTMSADASSIDSDQDHVSRIRAYYDETWLDYRLVWLPRQAPGMHFGYWDDQTSSHAQALVNLNRVLARSIGLRPGQRVLDAGCGVGGSAVWLAETASVEVVGITVVPNQVARAQRYAEERRVADRVVFAQQDYTQTRFPTASFDVVWAMESACHARDKRLFLAEARRLLAPGGRLGLVEYMRTDEQYGAADEALLASWLQGWAIPDLATSAQWMEWTRQAGFDDINVIDIMTGVMPSLRHLFQCAMFGWPFGLALRALQLRSAVQHGNIRGARDQYRAAKRGLWFPAVLTATAAP